MKRIGLGVALLGLALVAGGRAWADSPPVVEVTSSGAGPREALRYAPSVGDRGVTEVERYIDVVATIDGAEPPSSNQPQVVARVETEIASVDESSGTFVVRMTFSGAKVVRGGGFSDAAAASITEDVERVLGFGGSMTLDARGRVMDTSLQPPDSFNPLQVRVFADVLDAVSRATPVLPREPVGVGATWTVTRLESGQGIENAFVRRVELTERDGTDLRLRLRDRITAGRQAVNRDNQRPGTSAELLLMDGRGGGWAEVGLDAPLPHSLMTTTDVRTALSIERDGEPAQRVTQRSSVRIRLASTPAGGSDAD